MFSIEILGELQIGNIGADLTGVVLRARSATTLDRVVVTKMSFETIHAASLGIVLLSVFSVFPPERFSV